MSITKNSEMAVTVLQGQESFKIKPLLKANCWAVLEEDKLTYHAGERTSLYPFYPRTDLLSSEE